MMNLEEICNIIPHRHPFLLVDQVIEYDLMHSLKAIKNVTGHEDFFKGHFPARPVMPGVLIVEALAQAFSILATLSYPDPSKTNLFLMAGIDDTRFKRIVSPGDQLCLDVEMMSVKHGVFKGRGIASVQGEVACTTTLISVRREVVKHD